MEHVDISPALAEFAISLYKVVSSNGESLANVCVSPFSVAVVLSMAHVGAKSNTATQIKAALNLPKLDNGEVGEAIGKLCQDLTSGESYTLESANKMYVAEDYDLTEHFQTSMKTCFRTVAESVNFQSDETRLRINEWVQDFTHQKIKDLIPPGALNESKLALVNAVYFNGDWQNTFDEAETRAEPFYLGRVDVKVDVDMMHQNGRFNTGNIDVLDARILELPYLGHRLSMLIILPNQIDGLAAVESQLSANILHDIMNETSNTKLDVALPKFKVESNVQMKQVLQQMGMTDLFDPLTADFSPMSGAKDLFVSDVIHKAYIDVNEKGSEAAAATAFMLECTSIPITPDIPPAPFVADRPFIYLILDTWTQTILFIGKMTSPSTD